MKKKKFSNSIVEIDGIKTIIVAPNSSVPYDKKQYPDNINIQNAIDALGKCE